MLRGAAFQLYVTLFAHRFCRPALTAATQRTQDARGAKYTRSSSASFPVCRKAAAVSMSLLTPTYRSPTQPGTHEAHSTEETGTGRSKLRLQ